MPTSLVKTKADEKKWAHCKKSVAAKKGDKGYWPSVMGCYLKYKANASRKGKR